MRLFILELLSSGPRPDGAQKLGPAGQNFVKINLRAGFFAEPELRVPGSCVAGISHHHVLGIDCVARAVLEICWLDYAEFIRFRAVSVWARTWLLENFCFFGS